MNRPSEDGAVGRVLRADELATYRGAPLIVFVGISTAGSSVHRVHPAWAPLLVPGTELRGLDLPETVRPDELRRVVTDLCANPAIHGAVVTSHKLRIFEACHDLLDASDPLAELTHEFNCLAVSGESRGYARDPLSLATILDPGGPLDAENVVCIGAGGAATALLLAVCLDIGATLAQGKPVLRPSRRRLTVVGRTASSLAALRTVCAGLGLADDAVPLRITSDADEVAAIVASAPPGSLIVNATGLGKTSAASPLPDATVFPERAVAWDFNYRGPLTFLEQAAAAGLRCVDGWDYFVAGWSAALAAIGGVPFTNKLLQDATKASAAFAPRTG